MGWQDAVVAAPTSDPLWVVTSPNASFIPTPAVGQIQVMLRADYRYGIQDPVQWPQLFVEGFEYLSVVLRPSNDQHLAPIWWSPQEVDFDILEGSVIKCLGLLRSDCIAPLCRLVKQLSMTITSHSLNTDPTLVHLNVAMCHARDRVQHFPCTWRDACMQVREVQRYWLMARAFLDYNALTSHPGTTQAVREQYIGAFTTDPSQVQTLYCAGIPVWWLRMDASILSDTRVRAVVMLTEPHEICQEPALDAHVLYSGLAGSRHLACLGQYGHTYRDISRHVLLAVEQDRGYHAPVSQKEYKGILLGAASRTGRTSGFGESASSGQRGRQSNKSSKTNVPCKHATYCLDVSELNYCRCQTSSFTDPRCQQIRRGYAPVDAAVSSLLAACHGEHRPFESRAPSERTLGLLDSRTWVATAPSKP